MRLPKTITAVSIIVLVLMPCIYCLYFQVRHQMIRMEMEQKLKDDQVQTLIIPVKDFRWYEENREIVIDGTMFDVKSIHRQDDNYIVTGLYDTEETELHIAMGRLQQEQASGGPDTEFISFMLSETLVPPVAYDMGRCIDLNDLSYRAIYPDEKLYDTILSIHTPPPRA
ncbi:MAG: hypothetical protein WCF67_24620 [Chitinophagaceae bacterium]